MRDTDGGSMRDTERRIQERHGGGSRRDTEGGGRTLLEMLPLGCEKSVWNPNLTLSFEVHADNGWKSVALEMKEISELNSKNE